MARAVGLRHAVPVFASGKQHVIVAMSPSHMTVYSDTTLERLLV